MTKRKTAKPKNYVCIALDASSSMEPFRNQAIEVFNSTLRSLQDSDQDNYLGLVVFADNAVVKFPPTKVRNIQPLAYGDYCPNGWTALWDGTGLAAETLESMADADVPTVSNLIIAITDGNENRSLKYNESRLLQLLDRLQKTGRWTITFQVPKGNARRVAACFHIPESNLREWEQTDQGITEATEQVRVGLSSFLGARAAGQAAVQNFYVTPDLSRAKKDIKNLEDVTHKFAEWNVPKEEPIKEFVERRSRKPYVVGSAYYQLFKSEKVQPRKGVVIQDKKTKTLYGGDEARRLIGLPTDGVSHAKVVPGNHAGMEIYVQSTSANRKLPRGSKVIFDKTLKQSMAPTWTANG